MLHQRAATIALAAGALVLTTGGTALADDCMNVSRAPASCGYNCPTPVIEGNWVWLPSIAGSSAPPAWGFAPPGGPDSVGFGFAGASGNYTNGQAEDLLGVAGHHSTAVCSTPNRSGDPSQWHGIVSACGQAGG